MCAYVWAAGRPGRCAAHLNYCPVVVGESRDTMRARALQNNSITLRHECPTVPTVVLLRILLLYLADPHCGSLAGSHLSGSPRPSSQAQLGHSRDSFVTSLWTFSALINIDTPIRSLSTFVGVWRVFMPEKLPQIPDTSLHGHCVTLTICGHFVTVRS